MRDGGYATYYSGKWNLGYGLERSPGARGWDRYLALEQTGADNFQAKVYAPFNMEAVWWQDGQRAQLPADFFSSVHYTDKLIQFIDEGRAANKPFMAMLSFQAVHSPLQAPQADIDRYLNRYDEGWDKIRAERYARQVEMGLVPAGLTLPRIVPDREWAKLGDAERRVAARKMAVFAAMLDNADQQIGRLREHLRSTGELDNTVFIVMSDNGADAYDLSQLNLPMNLWYRMNYSLGLEGMGGKGSYVHYGMDWAQVSNTPFALVKATSGEGGMRVPFIVSFPGRFAPDRFTAGGTTDAFAYVTDFLPTVLDIAGIPLPGDDYKGQALLRPTGRSLLPLVKGEVQRVHGPDDAIGYEGSGGEALFMGDYKLLRNGPPLGRRVLAADQPARRPDRIQGPVGARTAAPAEDAGRGRGLSPAHGRGAARGGLQPGASIAGQQLAGAGAPAVVPAAAGGADRPGLAAAAGVVGAAPAPCRHCRRRPCRLSLIPPAPQRRCVTRAPSSTGYDGLPNGRCVASDPDTVENTDRSGAAGDRPVDRVRGFRPGGARRFGRGSNAHVAQHARSPGRAVRLSLRAATHHGDAGRTARWPPRRAHRARAFLWTVLTDPAQRRGRLDEALIATSRIVLLGLAMDTVYQFIEFDTFHPAEALIIALLLGVLPYLVLRGLVTRIARRWVGNKPVSDAQ